MTRDTYRLIAFVLLIAYASTSMGPRGALLCLGGGHDWNEIIAVGCAHGGHSHCGTVEPSHGHPECAGCVHDHDQSHGPCADIEIDVEAGRPTTQSSVKAVLHATQDTGMVAAWALPELHTAHLTVASPRNWDVVHARRQVTASLRATVLLI